MKLPRASRIKAASHADVNRPQWVLFLPDWTTAQTGKEGWGEGCTEVHPADATEGKQDTAGPE